MTELTRFARSLIISDNRHYELDWDYSVYDRGIGARARARDIGTGIGQAYNYVMFDLMYHNI